MVIEIFNIKKNRFHSNDWENFKQIAKKFNDIEYLQTGKSKSMFYIKVVGNKSTWKQILGNGTNFDYVPGGSSNNVEWNHIKVTINKQ